MNKLDKWSDYLPPEELATYAKGKFGERVGFGRRAAQQLLSVGLAPLESEFAAAELASWTTLARAILNLGETITRN